MTSTAAAPGPATPGPATLGPASLRQGLLAACAAVVEARAGLTELDGLAGDGDLGESLVIGFSAVRHGLDSSADEDVRSLLMSSGKALARAAPSTFGTLLGLALVDAGRGTAPGASLDGAAVAALLGIMADGVARRGEVRAGQRTVLDGLLASRDAATAVATDGPIAALAAAAAGARAGAASTAAMAPQVGRAGWIGERALGHVDAGASAWAVIAQGLSAGVTASTPP